MVAFDNDLPILLRVPQLQSPGDVLTAFGLHELSLKRRWLQVRHERSTWVPDDGNEERISLGHGGGFYHWGIIVSRPGYVPYYTNHYDKIADGIWGYRE
jgi:hypothetical protein